MTKQQLRKELFCLAASMAHIANRMKQTKCPNYEKHGNELKGASEHVAEWAEEILKEMDHEN